MINKKSFNKKRISNIILVAVIVALFAYIFLFNGDGETDESKYYQIVNYYNDGEVNDFTLHLGTGELIMTVDTDDGETEIIEYKVPDVGVFLTDISETVEEYNEEHPNNQITYDYIPVEVPNPLWSFLPYIFFFGLIALFYFFMMKRAEGGGKQAMAFGKSKVKPDENSNKVTFNDVAGVDEEKEELEEIVDFLKDPKKFSDIGARIPKGVLLVGPPGTGKTLLARAVSGEAGVPFFSISGSNFVEMFVGVGASRVRDLFTQAKKSAPSIIFIDEIDAVGRKRGAGLGGGNDEREQTLNQLLVEMDGFDNNVGVIIIAATNRADVLDPALLRPGRFDRQVYISFPDIKGREAILHVHARKKPFAPDVDFAVIAKATAGFTGADLENVLNEAALLTARTNKKAITMDDINEATVKVLVGPEKKSKVIKEEERKLTAYHEAGHAIATYDCDTQSTVHQISIIPRGMAGGYTMSLPDVDKSYKRKGEMIESIVVLLSGRVAEQQVLDDISTGASNDLQRATAIAKSMVTRYGFSERLGAVVYGGASDEIFVGRDLVQSRDYSESAASEIDKEVRHIIEEAYKKAEKILEFHSDKLHTVAKALLEFEKIDGAQFIKLMEGEIKEITEENAVVDKKTEKPVADEAATKE